MTQEDWKPSAEDFEYRPHDLLLLRYGRGAARLLGPAGELLLLSQHRQAVGFQTRSEAQQFIEQRARRYRGSLFFATRNELLNSLRQENPTVPDPA
jgi:hypothetical protein